MSPNAVPIIGATPTRGWLNIRVALLQDDQPVVGPDRTLHFPTYNWSVTMVGLRSDQVVCQAVGLLTAEDVTDPKNIAVAIVQVGRLFETYLNCACRPNRPCPLHAGPGATAVPT